ncbi:hydrophobin-like protein [Heterobasidion irregulare TC 32-1]|uniref:Hydrophobin n=1 Tax=Heterobasidion irregulare (strain TC 32-1) TaxID=747525 RepID=W4JZN2_HETIT|nr:hydrophobin-like protein [Heterobasidion irregulare TC 32-1]ETW78296.1 hydrophobin-like protein [Heterobasidion irregulare TC 32-1]
MFARVPTLFLAFFLCLACAASASAHPAAAASRAAAKPSATTKPSQSAAACNTGSIQCCNALQSAGAPGISVILGLLGIKVGDVNAIVGFGCAPITVGGAGAGASCAAQPVCCTGNSFNGLINIGCTPINI